MRDLQESYFLLTDMKSGDLSHLYESLRSLDLLSESDSVSILLIVSNSLLSSSCLGSKYHYLSILSRISYEIGSVINDCIRESI